MYDPKFMEIAVRLAKESARDGKGGPFGAVIVKDGEMIAACNNTVTPDNDPTAHAEVNVIRQACRTLNSFQLKGCELYTSCEPCPMCLGAIYWARPDRVYYASGKEDAAGAGFDDSFIYREIEIPAECRSIPFVNQKTEDAGEEFHLWLVNKSKKEY